MKKRNKNMMRIKGTLKSRLALLVEQMEEVVDEKREDQGWLL